MIDHWRSYSIADFVPFTAEVYGRLLERANEALWPLQLLTLAAGVAVVVLALRGRGRGAMALTAVAWVWVGPAFLMQRYGSLSWAGTWFGWAFLVEAAGLLLIAVSGRGIAARGDAMVGLRWGGLVIAMAGVVGYPLIAPLAGHGWLQAEIFGIHPDPTAVVTLGLCLAALRGPLLWTAAALPGLWCLVAGLTLHALEVEWAPALLAVAALAVVGPSWASLRRSR